LDADEYDPLWQLLVGCCVVGFVVGVWTEQVWAGLLTLFLYPLLGLRGALLHRLLCASGTAPFRGEAERCQFALVWPVVLGFYLLRVLLWPVLVFFQRL
jgi:hypothetical protein